MLNQELAFTRYFADLPDPRSDRAKKHCTRPADHVLD